MKLERTISHPETGEIYEHMLIDDEGIKADSLVAFARSIGITIEDYYDTEDIS